MRTIWFVCSVILIPAAVLAGGENSFEFLDVEPGNASAAMAGAGVARTASLEGVFDNPASLGGLGDDVTLLGSYNTYVHSSLWSSALAYRIKGAAVLFAAANGVLYDGASFYSSDADVQTDFSDLALRAGVAGQWATSDGVPTCGDHGLMKRKWGQDFFLAKERIRSGVRRGDLSRAAQTSAHLRFRCIDPQCPVGEVTTYVRDDPRLYTYLPRKGKLDELVGKRAALLTRHNIAESVNARLKGRGVGLRGQRHPKWVSSDRQMEWLVGGTLRGMSFQRLAHESGEYARALDEARAQDFIKEPLASGR